MDYRSLHAKTVADLRKIAKDEGVKLPAGTKKAVMVEMILERMNGGAAQAVRNVPSSVRVEKAEQQVSEAEPAPSPAAQSDGAAEASVKRRVGRPRLVRPTDSDAEATRALKAPAARKRAPETIPMPAEKIDAPEVKTDQPAAQPDAAKVKAPASRRGATKTNVTNAQSDAIKTDPSAAQSDAAKTDPSASRSGAAKVKAPAFRRGAAKTDASAAQSDAAKTDPSAAQSDAAKTNAPVAQLDAAKTDAAVAQSDGVRTGVSAMQSDAVGAQTNAPAIVPERPTYQRPMSTQQRMGARTQPVQNYRTPARNGAVQGRTPARFNAESPQTRQGRSFENHPNGYRRPSEGMPQRGTFRRAPEGAQPNGYRRPMEEGQSNNYRRPMEEGQSNSYRRPMEEGQPNNYRRPMEEGQSNSYRHPMEEGQVNNYRGDAGMPTREEVSAAPAQAGEDTRAMGDAPRYPRFAQPEGSAVRTESMNPAVPDLVSSGECGDGAGILEIHPDGYGFLRAENYLPGNRDVYVSAAQIRRFNLRTGDYVVGKTRAQQMGDRSVGLIYINEVNGQSPEKARNRRPFDSLVPVYPDERLRMESENGNDISLRLIDMIAPIGKGQRGMIVSPPKAGKTTLLKKVANAITRNNPDVRLIVLLIDERPEEVTDMQRSIQGEVVYSTFDEAPENHTRVSEMVLERAQRLVELGEDVVVLLDSITRLARAYNLVIPPTGRSLSGGLDPGALLRPKRFFGAARNIENGGSLTIIATALVDTGSRMDDIIFEEFKGTGNMELHLDRSLSDRRIFPAIDLHRSGTRREELLLSKEELEGVYQARRMLSKGSPQEAAEQLISLMEKTKTNVEFYQKLKGWLNVCEKDGFTMRSR